MPLWIISLTRAPVLLTLLTVLLCACTPKPDAAKMKAESQRRFGQLQGKLQQQLKAALKKDGPHGAITVCARVSPDLERRQTTDQVRIRRVSDRARNPAHRLDQFEKGVFARWRTDMAAGRAPQVVAQAHAADFRVMKPILLARGVCLACHGAPGALDARTRKALKKAYPDDRAVGYKLGDLRGAFSAVWPNAAR